MPRSATANVDVSTGILVGASGPRKRRYYYHDFDLIPNLAAGLDVNATHSSSADADIEEAFETNKDWALAGTNAVFASGSFATGGGVTLTTTAAANDQMQLLPNSSALVKTGLEVIDWDTSKQPAVEWGFRTPSTITNMTFWCGFAITNPAPYNVTDDHDQIKVEYVTGVNSGNFVVRYSNGTHATDNDFSINTGLAFEADTSYWCKIRVGSDRLADVTIGTANEPGAATHTRTENALRADILTLKPAIGVQTSTGARAITVDYVAIGRDR